MNKEAFLGLIRHALTALGGGIVAKGAVDESAMTDIIGGLILIAGAVWSIVEKRSRKPQVPAVPLLLLLASVAFVGCQTTNQAGRTLATIAQAEKAAVKGWLTYVETSGQVTPDDEAKVETVHERFRIALRIAESAYQSAVKAGDLSVYDRAYEALEKSKADVLRLIDELSKPKPKPQAKNVPAVGSDVQAIYIKPAPLSMPLYETIYIHTDGSRCDNILNCKEQLHTGLSPL